MSQQAIAGRYELLEGLDSGGMGDVWRGYDAVLDRPVAVKLIRQQAVLGSPQLAEEFAKRFRREARITAKIRHPGVPQVYDAVLDDSYERLYLVMELVDGVALSSYIHPERPLPVSWAVAVAAQVATVLSYAHEVPVIHRDLKPGNILVARDGTVKVLDFGIAAILRSDVTKLTATGCRAQAARCRGELGQVTDALASLRGVLEVVRAVDGDVSDEAAELRRDIGMLLLAQGLASEAARILAPLYDDLCLVFGSDDEMTEEVAEALALIRLDLDGPTG
ncbi:serine/threonine-protein kinase [Streptomyces sp. NPDC026589]|uniref:serine/threonine-protein kinase n=1 Tax=Streptomyces sp. NPDC026589 TaxID=3155609 RepID=UPI0033C70FDB